jgi:hypothetical protein
LAEETESLKQAAGDRWSIERSFHNPGNWTRRLIQDTLIFVKRNRRINHYVIMMQILTGHGIFNYFPIGIGSARRAIPVAGIVGTTWTTPSTCSLSALDGW